jgi:hypothetical protein
MQLSSKETIGRSGVAASASTGRISMKISAPTASPGAHRHREATWRESEHEIKNLQNLPTSPTLFILSLSKGNSQHVPPCTLHLREAPAFCLPASSERSHEGRARSPFAFNLVPSTCAKRISPGSLQPWRFVNDLPLSFELINNHSQLIDILNFCPDFGKIFIRIFQLQFPFRRLFS